MADAIAIEQFAFLSPLYSRHLFSAQDVGRLKMHLSCTFDMYCCGCKKDATFKITKRSSVTFDEQLALASSHFTTLASCTRSGHLYRSELYTAGDGIVVKYGQLPSVESIQGAEVRKYRTILRDGYFEELTRATGLASHGIGIGSFVYLRRIFEKLIADHRIERENVSGPIEGFDRMRMDEKVAALSDVLPSALVENKPAYSILSKGIHELSEAECRAYFPLIRSAIILILEEDFQARERRKASEQVRNEMQRLASELGSKPGGSSAANADGDAER